MHKLLSFSVSAVSSHFPSLFLFLPVAIPDTAANLFSVIQANLSFIF